MKQKYTRDELNKMVLSAITKDYSTDAVHIVYIDMNFDDFVKKTFHFDVKLSGHCMTLSQIQNHIARHAAKRGLLLPERPKPVAKKQYAVTVSKQKER